MKIYLDVCCLNRPFDDLSQDRVNFESNAVLSIISRCRDEEWELYTSEVTDLELSMMPNQDRLAQVKDLASVSCKKLTISDEAEARAIEFQSQGIKAKDGLHLAVAEMSELDVFLTTDDKFLRIAKSIGIKITAENPVTWLMEVLKNER
ncbi:hypothetical protein AGMMS49983_12580 [Clostridia bacterium]|nr:hypothetical protein AGMMS49983_12580 [Clostridia bacterium]